MRKTAKTAKDDALVQTISLRKERASLISKKILQEHWLQDAKLEIRVAKRASWRARRYSQVSFSDKWVSVSPISTIKCRLKKVCLHRGGMRHYPQSQLAIPAYKIRKNHVWGIKDREFCNQTISPATSISVYDKCVHVQFWFDCFIFAVVNFKAVQKIQMWIGGAHEVANSVDLSLFVVIFCIAVFDRLGCMFSPLPSVTRKKVRGEENLQLPLPPCLIFGEPHRLGHRNRWSLKNVLSGERFAPHR